MAGACKDYSVRQYPGKAGVMKQAMPPLPEPSAPSRGGSGGSTTSSMKSHDVRQYGGKGGKR